MDTLRQTFPLARYRLEFRVIRPVRLPDYAGSMLRGAFGRALRQVACITRQPDCAGCALTGTCPYVTVFSPTPPAEHALQKFSQIPAPYIIDPPAWGARTLSEGSELAFHFTLIGKAIDELPIIILAWRRALARGIGANDGTADLVRVTHTGASDENAPEHEIYRPETGRIEPHRHVIDFDGLGDDGSDAVSHAVTLHFVTPLRLQENGRALPPERLTPRTLLMALVRRASLLAEFHAAGPLLTDFASITAGCSDIRDTRHLEWRDWSRYSSRQQQKMTLGGVVGTWTLEGRLKIFFPYLRLGQWLRVGKEAVFGLGRYDLQTHHVQHNFEKTFANCDYPVQPIDSTEIFTAPR